MSIEDLGNLGELVAAIATVATLIYLAVQIKLNTRAIKAATFQSITSEMANNVEPVSSNADLAALAVKALEDPSSLTAEERMRTACVYLATFRRMESVFVQNKLGSIEDDMMKGFETSMTSLLRTPFGRKWWENAKVTFYEPFVVRMDECVNSEDIPASRQNTVTEKLKAPEPDQDLSDS